VFNLKDAPFNVFIMASKLFIAPQFKQLSSPRSKQSRIQRYKQCFVRAIVVSVFSR